MKKALAALAAVVIAGLLIWPATVSTKNRSSLLDCLERINLALDGNKKVEVILMGTYTSTITCDGINTAITEGTTYEEHLDAVKKAIAHCEKTGGTTGRG